MAYELDTIKLGQRIFYYLLQNRQLKEEDESQLYRTYSENEEVSVLVKEQAEISDCTVEKYGGIIYLIPNVTNNYLGYSKNELKKRLCKSTANDKDYYLSQFVIITLLVNFYNSKGQSSKSRDYMKVGELMNEITNRLTEGASYMKGKEDIEDAGGIAYTNILERFEALRSTDGANSKAKTTKEGFLEQILIFLEEQDLIDYIKEDEMIKTTRKLDNLMDFNILNQNNYDRVTNLLKEVSDEQN